MPKSLIAAAGWLRAGRRAGTAFGLALIAVLAVQLGATRAPSGSSGSAAVAGLGSSFLPDATAVAGGLEVLPDVAAPAALQPHSVSAPGTSVPPADLTPPAVSGQGAVEPPAAPATSTPSSTVAVLFGATVSTDGGMLANLDRFGRNAGTTPGLVMWFEQWASGTFDRARADAVAARGAQPMVTWEPWDEGGSAQQPAYALATITAGQHDPYIRSWARAVGSFGKPVLVRFAHEMNGGWYPWAEGVNGNRPGDYVAAWRHVVSIFREEGVNNVRWVWSPNIAYAGSTPMGDLYPGDSWVDWVALDGYNGGSALPWGGWLSFDQLFAASLRELGAVSPGKPVMIGETASTEEGGNKAGWINGFFDMLEQHPEIRAFVWFDYDKETDWRIESSPTAQQTFAARVADPRYR